MTKYVVENSVSPDIKRLFDILVCLNLKFNKFSFIIFWNSNKRYYADQPISININIINVPIAQTSINLYSQFRFEKYIQTIYYTIYYKLNH